MELDNDWDARAHVRVLRASGGSLSMHTADLIEHMVSVLEDLAEAARNSCDAQKHPKLTEALSNADRVLLRETGG